MDKLRLVQGPEAVELLGRTDIKTYPYVLNKPGLYLVLGVAGVLYVLAAWLWLGGQADTLTLKIALVASLVVATGLSILVTYYNHVGASRVVGLGEDWLIVGEKDKFWAISWELLDLETLGLKDMELSRGSGSLEIHVGGQDIRLLLYSPFALLADPQDFMLNLLSRFQQEHDGEEE